MVDVIYSDDLIKERMYIQFVSKKQSITCVSVVHAKAKADTTFEVSDIRIQQNTKCRNNVTMRRIWIFASWLHLR